MAAKRTKVLFLCTQNSARSILAECVLNRLGAGRFEGHSAGSHPAGRVNPGALALLARAGHPTAGLRSKSWHDFADPGALEMDLVITVCGNAAGEVCPVWPGGPARAHWPLPDPAAVADPAARAEAFAAVYRDIEARVAKLIAEKA
jgi:protein-tyrosine-phosphatase